MTRQVGFELHEMDCRLAMRMMLDENSVDSIVTDPPYGLSKEPDMLEVLRHWMAGDDYVSKSPGFMAAAWDSFVPGPSVWREAYRVLKPGGYLVAFFGTRTYDLGVLAIRLAGFEIRDQIAWAYGSGFPKSLDVSKAIDKAAGAERILTREGTVKRDGYGEDWDTGSSADRPRYDNPATPEAARWQGYGTALKPAFEPIVVARKPLGERTVAANVLRYGTGALNIDASRVENTEYDPTKVQRQSSNRVTWEGGTASGFAADHEQSTYNPGGRWPANLAHDGSNEVLAVFPDARGQIATASTSDTPRAGQNTYGAMLRGSGGSEPRDDSGSAARFFKSCPMDDEDGETARLMYCAKASRTDRGVGNTHPTVKPTALMRWLVKLVTPQGGTVLDPFTGSGSTGKAAMLEGFDFVGCELDPDYVRIAEARFVTGVE